MNGNTHTEEGGGREWERTFTLLLHVQESEGTKAVKMKGQKEKEIKNRDKNKQLNITMNFCCR